MDNNTPPPPLLPPLQPHSQPQPQPRPQTLSLPPPPTMPPPLHHNHPHFLLPFSPPTTPTTSSPSTITHHKKRRSKLLRIDTATTTTMATKKPKNSFPTEVIPPCTECGKVFWSKKALFGHMRCHPERPWRGINPPSHLPHTPPRTPTTIATATDDHEVAASLLLLASGPDIASPSSLSKFECSSCKKTFGSHQALGGHRASHKNVKGCFAITKNTTDVDDDHFMTMQTDQNHEESVGLGLSLGLSLGHRCGVCLKVFPTGQALGGHMRCHWEKSEDHQHQQAQVQALSSSFGLGFGQVSGPSEAQCCLDLNLPAQLGDDGYSYFLCSNNMQLDLRLAL